jgi:Flp pilus assembly secretin CpaC
MFRWIFVAALVMSSGSVLAQTPLSTAYGAAKVIKYPEQYGKIDLQVGHTRFLRLDRQFKSVVVGDPRVADIVVEDQHTVLITAKGPDGATTPNANATAAGPQRNNTTNLIFLDNANEPIFLAEVEVNTAPPADPLGRVKVYGVSGQGSAKAKIADYIPWACTTKDCIRLKEEYQGEKSNELFVPGLKPQSPSINVNTENVSAPGS